MELAEVSAHPATAVELNSDWKTIAQQTLRQGRHNALAQSVRRFSALAPPREKTGPEMVTTL